MKKTRKLFAVMLTAMILAGSIRLPVMAYEAEQTGQFSDDAGSFQEEQGFLEDASDDEEMTSAESAAAGEQAYEEVASQEAEDLESVDNAAAGEQAYAEDLSDEEEQESADSAAAGEQAYAEDASQEAEDLEPVDSTAAGEQAYEEVASQEAEDLEPVDSAAAGEQAYAENVSDDEEMTSADSAAAGEQGFSEDVSEEDAPALPDETEQEYTLPAAQAAEEAAASAEPGQEYKAQDQTDAPSSDQAAEETAFAAEPASLPDGESGPQLTEKQAPEEQASAEQAPEEQISAEQASEEQALEEQAPEETLAEKKFFAGGEGESPAREVLIEYFGEEVLVATQAVLGAEENEEAPSFHDYESAVSYVREQMLAREETIPIIVPSSVVEQLDLERYSDVLAHTGNSKGGDYLRSTLCAMWSYGSPYGDDTFLLEYHFGYYTSSGQEEEADAEVERLIASLGLKDSAKSDYEKIKAIHDYISATVSYDYDTVNGVRDDYPQTYSGYGAIVHHLAVCQGYSSMFYRLCLEAGIDARIITSNSMSHAWNIVQLEGCWYLMDCTWDENTGSDSWFLCGKYDFSGHENSDDQFRDEDFANTYPLSDFHYGLVIKNLGAAPAYTLITTDHRTISTQAEGGRAKAIVFFKEGCGNCQVTLESLRGKAFPGVDLICAYIGGNTLEQQYILSQIGAEFPTDIPGTYVVCGAGGDALNAMEKTAGIADPNGWLYTAAVFLISADNQIIYAEHGYAGNFTRLIDSFLTDPDAPEAPAPLPDPYGSFTAMGNCGQNAVWRYYEDGTVRISGTGDLWDEGYTWTNFGWMADGYTEESSYSCENIEGSDIRNIIVEDGITYIGWNTFNSCTELESITFKGHAPSFSEYPGLYHDICIYYPENDATWNSVNKTAFTDGTRWISQDADGVHHHAWSAWKTTKAATVQQEGAKKRTCSQCLQTQTAAIPKLDPISIADAAVTFPASIVYNGKAQKPAPTVKVGSKTLKSGTDYTITYSSNTNAGKASVTITGKGDYTGQRTASFTIEKAAQSITAKASLTTVSVGKTATVSITGAKGTKSYTSSNASVATVTAAGVVTAKKVGTVKITAKSAAAANYKAASRTVTINVVPAATQTLTAVNLAKGMKLTWKKVTGATGYRLYRGTTLVKTIKSGSTVTFTDTNANTNGTKYTFKVIATASTGASTLSRSVTAYRVAATSLTSAANTAAGKATVKWDINNAATGYQIQYSTSKTFAGGNKTLTITNKKTVSKVISGLTKGKTYYIRIRACKTVGSTGSDSAWSAAKTVKIIK